MNWISEVWSNTSEQTQPPLDHGEMTSMGTRKPRPYGHLGFPGLPGKISLVASTVDLPRPLKGGVGGTT